MVTAYNDVNDKHIQGDVMIWCVVIRRRSFALCTIVKHTRNISQYLYVLVFCCFNQQKDDISLSEGSTVDLRKPGEEEDEYSEMAEEAMDPDNCFPDSKNKLRRLLSIMTTLAPDNGDAAV